jgi:hypothetical protein
MHMLIQPTLESLQEKYAKHLKDEAIQDFIPVSYKFKNCNLVLTETRLICIQDDINGLKPHFTLQKQSIKQITYSSYSITIKYPRSVPLKVSFTGLNSHKNQTFAKNLPKSQLHKANKTEVSIVLGGGAALILLLVVGAIINPRSYADRSPSPENFWSDCRDSLVSKYPDAKIVHSPPVLPPGNKGYLTFELRSAQNPEVYYFVCSQDESGNFRDSKGS